MYPLLHRTTIACIDVLVLFLLLLKVCKDCIHVMARNLTTYTHGSPCSIANRLPHFLCSKMVPTEVEGIFYSTEKMWFIELLEHCGSEAPVYWVPDVIKWQPFTHFWSLINLTNEVMPSSLDPLVDPCSAVISEEHYSTDHNICYLPQRLHVSQCSIHFPSHNYTIPFRSSHFLCLILP